MPATKVKAKNRTSATKTKAKKRTPAVKVKAKKRTSAAKAKAKKQTSAVKAGAKKRTPATKVSAKKRMPAKKAKDIRMNLPEIRMKAKALGLKPGRMKKSDLIHTIQITEGYSPCFGRSDGYCSYTDCCFMKDCLKIAI